MSGIINPEIIEKDTKTEFQNSGPFNHIVFDNFFDSKFADSLNVEFPAFDSPLWYKYDNAIENKRAMNSWDRFPKSTYKAFQYLTSDAFIQQLERWTGISGLVADVGLHGGGWHSHSLGGKLNVHLDYSIHPKLELERRLNLIVYLTKDWVNEWGGGLQLWSHDAANHQPGRCEVIVDNVFNRGVLFDTTQNSWHGLPDPLHCPEGVVRQSIAVYYLCEPRAEAADRAKAHFAPYKEQKNDASVLKLIEERSALSTAASSYRSVKKT